MKNVLSICFVLIINLSFAQESLTDVINSFANENKEAFSLTTNEDAKFLQFQEIIPVHFERNTTIKEGKFSWEDIKDKNITSLLSELDKSNREQFLSIEEINLSKNNSIATKSIKIATNQKFINKIITDKTKQRNLNNKSINLTNSALVAFNNFPEMLDLLNVNYTLTRNLELEIGDNIYSFINKPFKSELDKTLFNSLNLLTLNL
jgi:ribosomal protein L17